MNDLNAILKNLDWNHRRPFGWGSSPDADWKVIFLSTIFCVLLVGALSLLLFYLVEKGSLFSSVEETISVTPSLDIEKLKTTLSRYEERAAEFERLIGGTATVVGDPSI